MHTLVLKLVITPVLIQAASLAGRRWGETVGGWFVGLPLTSGPIAFFLTLDQGAGFAAAAAAGSLAGAVAEAGFCLGYSTVARRLPWPAAIVAGSIAFAAVGAVLQGVALPVVALTAILCMALVLALYLMPHPASGRRSVAIRPRWDIPARMTIATLLVLAITAAAPLLGARLSGLLATYPIFALVLAAFAHRQQGEAASRRVLRGLLLGLFGFAGFFLFLALTIERVGIGPGFAGATLAALAIQACTFRVMRRQDGPPLRDR